LSKTPWFDIVKSAAQYAVGASRASSTAIWSVAVFSLETDDYKEILKSAGSLALGLADGSDSTTDRSRAESAAKPSLSQAVGPVKFSLTAVRACRKRLSFTDGYKAGVAYYFSQVIKIR
jgi:hypothetical protein